ncbi:MAG TPA: hypothetical protein VL992_08455 [Tepidisphaeraceae bacterium]|nr:hypothetical protein [Tepidisphaeraceae bacterium]
MAKRKHVALFEVIQKDKRLSRQGGALPAPAWFNKNQAASSESRPPMAATTTPPARAIFKRILPSAVEPAKPVEAKAFPPPRPVASPPATPPVPPAPPPPPLPPPVPVMATPLVERPLVALKADETDAWPVVDNLDGMGPMDFGPRKQKRDPSPLFTPASGAIIAAIVILALGIHFGLRHMHRHAALAQAALNGPPHPEVLDVRPDGDDHATEPTAVAPTLPPEQAQPAAAMDRPGRQAGQCYVLVHLYVNPKTAGDVCAYLSANGIPCTIEQNLRGFGGQYHAVVGLTAFDHSGTPEYSAYITHMKEVLSTLPGATQITRSIRPLLIRWEQRAGPA